MCLLQKENTDQELTIRTGDLCVEDLSFMHADSYVLNFDGTDVAGIIGLGPHGGEHNFVQALYDQRQIDEKKAIIHLQPWGVRGYQSQIVFGEVDYEKVVHNEEGMNYYSNLGRDHWGLMIDDFMYNGVDCAPGQGAKIAIIDSANTTIQLPGSVFDNMLTELMDS